MRINVDAFNLGRIYAFFEIVFAGIARSILAIVINYTIMQSKEAVNRYVRYRYGLTITPTVQALIDENIIEYGLKLDNHIKGTSKHIRIERF